MNSWIVFNKDWCPSISTTVLVYLVECPGLNPDMEMLVIENFWSKLFKLLNEWKHYVPESWISEKENELCCWSTLHCNSDNFLLLNVSKKKNKPTIAAIKGMVTKLIKVKFWQNWNQQEFSSFAISIVWENIFTFISLYTGYFLNVFHKQNLNNNTDCAFIF